MFSKSLNIVVEVVIRIIHEIRSCENIGCIEFMIQTSIIVLCVYFLDLSRLVHIGRIQSSLDFSR